MSGEQERASSDSEHSGVARRGGCGSGVGAGEAPQDLARRAGKLGCWSLGAGQSGGGGGVGGGTTLRIGRRAGLPRVPSPAGVAPPPPSHWGVPADEAAPPGGRLPLCLLLLGNEGAKGSWPVKWCDHCIS